MKRQLLVLLITIICFNSIAQISFEKGYFINNAGQKIDCLIKNIDWENNPTEFRYKLFETEDTKINFIESVKEFGIYNISKYQRFTVKIDRSSRNVNDLSTDKNPIFTEEQLFLKVLVEGKANLYLYEEGNLKRYFQKVNKSKIEQLVFKKYKTKDNEIAKNVNYKQQLWINLKCEAISLKNIKSTDYKTIVLVNLFVKYNECSNAAFTNFTKKNKKELTHITIRPGLINSSLSIHNSLSKSRNAVFDDEFGIRLGVEAEFILPFNKNKWSIIVEPTYLSFEFQKELSSQSATAKYSTIELPIGVRHYFFLNEKSKLFLNTSYSFDFTLNSRIEYDLGTDLDIKTKSNLAFGLGYNYINKYSVEIRYGTSREILSDYIYWSSDYNSLSIIFGYTLF